MMDLPRGLALVAFTLTTLTGPSLARAAMASCMSADGSCEVSNDGFDWTDCTCADGSGGGGGGGNMWAGLTEIELALICEEQLASFCGPFVPPDYVECFGLLGSCIVDNDPEDSAECWCFDGTMGGFAGGNMWAGYTDEQLLVECETLLDATCVPPPSSVMCSNDNGECTIANVPEDFLACDCGELGGGAFGGGNAWAGYSELELYTECGTQLVGMCGGAVPPLPWLECSSRLGECMIDNDPEDLIDCTCTDGTEFSNVGGNAWAGLDEAALFMECEVQLYEGCALEMGSSGDSGSESGDTGDTDSADTTGAPSSTGEDTDGPGLDSSGGTTGGSGEPPPVPGTGGDDAPIAGSSEGGDPGAGDGGGEGCACSASPRGSSGWMLGLLGLVLVRRRRRPASGPSRSAR